MSRGKQHVVVIGGGPAGALAAIRLARSGVHVTIVDRGRRPGAIAEVLSPNAQQILRAANLWGRTPADVLAPCHAIVSAWGGPRLATTSFVRHPYGAARRVDRARFDEWLRTEAFQAGARVVVGTVIRVDREFDGWKVHVRGVPDVLHADVTVVATGRGGFRLPEMGHRVHLDSMIMLGGLFDAKMASDSALLVESVPSGWWYSVMTTTGLMFAAWMTDALCIKGSSWRQDMFAGLSTTRFTQQRLESIRSVVSSPASSSYSQRCSGPCWFAIGDAALARDPLSGEGVTQALSSGWDVASTILSVLDGSPYASEERATAQLSAVREYIAAWSEMYRREQRWGDAAFWSARSDSKCELMMTAA